MTLSDYFNDLGFKSFLDDIIDGKLPKISEAVMKKFPELKSELNLKAAISLFYYLILHPRSEFQDDLKKIISITPEEYSKHKDVNIEKYYKNFNGKYKSDINQSVFYQILKVIKSLIKYWENSVKNVNNKYTDKSTPEDKSNRISTLTELGREFAVLSLLPISDVERIDDSLKDEMGNVVDIGSLFFIPRQKYADAEYMNKFALFERFFGSDDDKERKEPSEESLEESLEKSTEERAKAWEGYDFPYQNLKTDKKPSEEGKSKELSIPYPSPISEEDSDEDKKSYQERKKDNKNYLKYNVFKVTDKFKRKDPYGDASVPWVAGIRFDVSTNTETPYYKIKVPVYMISADDSFIYDYFPRPQSTLEKIEEPKEKSKYLIPPKSKESYENIDEELFIHEAIYEILLDIVKEAEEIKPSEAINQGDAEAIDPETGKKMKLTKKNDYVEGLPEGGGPEESEYFDPTTAEALNKLNIVQK